MTIYMQYTNAKGGVSIQQHQVWDKARFLEARKAEWVKEGGSAAEVDASTYRAANWRKS